MTGSKFLTALAAFACAAAMTMSLPALANGGGGGGGGGSSGPSSRGGPDLAQAYRLGVTAYEAHDYVEAIRQFRIVQRAAPDDASINFALGLAYVGNGDHGGARTPLERAVRTESAPAGAWLNLGLVYLQLGNRDRAVQQQAALNAKIVACDAACGDARRAQLQSALDSLTRALETPTEQPAADPNTGWNFPAHEEGRLAYAAAIGLINSERYADGLEALALAQAAIGPQADILNYQGFASRHLGRFDAALSYYQEALALEPDHLGANEYLGELYLQMGRTDDARRQLARLDQLCAYGCAQREELARWIEVASN
jgi:tetratricopeptide (TPR) repeat protein